MDEKMQSKGITEISLERIRQVAVEGFGAEHDAQWVNGELVLAALTYLIWHLFHHLRRSMHGYPWNALGELWPWDLKWWKPTDPVRDLAKAGALIAAEIDRIDKLAESEKSE